MMQEIDFLKLIAEDKKLVTYRASWRDEIGSVTAVILLSQMIYWDDMMGGEPFYKFKMPCKHPDYKPGDSWSEELGFSGREFDSALKKIACRIRGGSIPEGGKALVYYWSTTDRKTFYRVDKENIAKCVLRIYLNAESASTYMRKAQPDSYTETTRDYPSARSGKESPKSTPEKKKESSKVETPHQELLRLYQDALGYPIPNGGQEGAAAKKILRSYTAVDAISCYSWLKQNPFYDDKHLSLMAVNKQLGTWINSGKPSQYTSASESAVQQAARKHQRSNTVNDGDYDDMVIHG